MGDCERRLTYPQLQRPHTNSQPSIASRLASKLLERLPVQVLRECCECRIDERYTLRVGKISSWFFGKIKSLEVTLLRDGNEVMREKLYYRGTLQLADGRKIKLVLHITAESEGDCATVAVSLG
ncbi:MAG: hypothetical protein V1492_03435 [Candidatus Micrarchaeota archaeon]